MNGLVCQGNINVKVMQGMRSAVANLILNIQGLKFEKYGTYRIDLTIDNQNITDLPFTIREVPKQA